MLAVMHQLVDGLVYIRQCRVFLLLFKSAVDLWPPPLGQLFQCADVEIAVMEERTVGGLGE